MIRALPDKVIKGIMELHLKKPDNIAIINKKKISAL
jgi:hypothetical protein